MNSGGMERQVPLWRWRNVGLFPCLAEINQLFLQETSVWLQNFFVLQEDKNLFGKKIVLPNVNVQHWTQLIPYLRDIVK